MLLLLSLDTAADNSNTLMPLLLLLLLLIVLLPIIIHTSARTCSCVAFVSSHPQGLS
jgi:hypothetical protein